MKPLALIRYALSVATAVLLTACGGSQPPIGAPGAMPQGRAISTHAERGGSRALFSVQQAQPTAMKKNVQTETVLHTFSWADGAVPTSSLTNVGGTFYGTTNQGGAYGFGTVFKITRSGSETVVHSFGTGTDGQSPYGGLTNVGGTLYGTTTEGGVNDTGTVFEITTSGTESVIHSFGKVTETDGLYPWASLTDVHGTLYGTTSQGGASGLGTGTVFKITTSGGETVLHSFGALSGADGSAPIAGLTNVNGKLYGTTTAGGTSGNGVVFEITKSGNETVLYNFAGAPDGTAPEASLTNVGGTLYGTTVEGGIGNWGTVFKMTLSGQETMVYSFKSGADGSYPKAALTNVHGTLFGVTDSGGASGYGTIFAILNLHTEVVLFAFVGGDGAEPDAALININRRLYGTTRSGGGAGYGTVFLLSP